MTNISFDNPYLLFIAIPLFALILIPFIFAFRKQNLDKHVIASLILHVLMIVCVTLAAAGLSATRVVTETNVYVVADVSYSSHLNFEEIDGYVSKVKSKLPKNSKMGVVCFGKDVLLHNAMGEDITSVSTAVLDDSGTDIFNALTYTAGLFEENVMKHIVLITDGNQTDGAEENELYETIATLKQKGIYVNAIYVDATLPADVVEIQLNNVEYVQSTYLGQGTEAIAYLQSNTATTAVVNVEKDGEIVDTMTVELTPGQNDFTFTLDTTAAGTFDYTLTVSDENDDLLLNNSYSFTQTVTDKRKVLFITAETTDEKNAEELFGGDDVDLEIKKYDGKKKLKVPTTIEALCEYDQIILSNINIPDQVEGYTQFIDNLNVAVSIYGKSLLTFGDLQLQTKTDNAEDLTNLEDMLPVQYGMRNDATLFGVVIDVSRSMNSKGKMQTAKDAALFMIDQFTPQDGIIIVSYSAAGELVMSMRNADEKGKQLAREHINALTPIQGTYVAGGLERMRVEMNSHDFANKQVLLIGDSMQASATTQGASAQNVAKQMYAEGIRVSTLNIDNEKDEGGFKQIASSGKGKYYKGFTEADLKSVLEDSLVENLMGTVVQTTKTVDVQLATDAVLKGITSFNPIKGYICSKAKGDAVVVLTFDHETADGTKTKMPLYSYRDCGKGKVATFNSKIGGNWVTDFLDKKGEQAGMKLFYNMLIENTPTERIDTPCLYTVTPDSNTTIEVVPNDIRKATTVEVKITTPSGQEELHTLRFDGSRHVATIETLEIGKYAVEISYLNNGEPEIINTTFMIPYIKEHDRFVGYSAGMLYDLVDERGIVSWDGEDIRFDANEDEIETYVYSFVVPLMIACVSLFIVDVFVRKIRWSDIKSLFVRTNKKSNKGGKR